MKSAEEHSQLRSKMIEHLEAAIAIADETQESAAKYLMEMALYELRAREWPDNLPMS